MGAPPVGAGSSDGGVPAVVAKHTGPAGVAVNADSVSGLAVLAHSSSGCGISASSDTDYGIRAHSKASAGLNASDTCHGHSGAIFRSRWTRLCRSAVIVSAVMLVTGLAGVSHAGQAPTGAFTQLPRAASFDVEFTDCSELASITTITVAKARTVVPATFTLAGDASGVPFVVRVAHCHAVSIDGRAPEAGTVAQLGVSIVSPDGTGDINNYTAWYYTTSKRLAVKLQLLGVPAQWVPRLGYHLVPNSANTGTLGIHVAIGHPAFHLTAPVIEPAAAAAAFEANWWIQSGTHRTKMSTPIPALRFGTATTTMTTPSNGQLGRLLDGPTETFALLDSYNRFPDAHMTVATNRP
jgi:hypothetical protein